MKKLLTLAGALLLFCTLSAQLAPAPITPANSAADSLAKSAADSVAAAKKAMLTGMWNAIKDSMNAQQQSCGCETPGKYSCITVVSVLNTDSTQRTNADLDDYLELTIDGPKTQLQDSAALNDVVLYINHIPMYGLPIRRTACNKLLVQLRHDSTSQKAWAVFYHGRLTDDLSAVISIGNGHSREYNSLVKNFRINLYNSFGIIFAALLFVAMLVLFVILARNTGIIRDDNTELPIRQRAFSLGRTQLAFWMFLIVFSYLYLLARTGAAPVLTGTTIVLLGISISTTTGAVVIDNSQRRTAHKSDNFLKDLITDSSDVNIHRFQMVVWTIVFGFFFIRTVIAENVMPQFSNNELILMGISGGAYLGLKIPEQKTTAPDNNQGNPQNAVDNNNNNNNNPPAGQQ